MLLPVVLRDCLTDAEAIIKEQEIQEQATREIIALQGNMTHLQQSQKSTRPN
jgi:hypothetical protein